MKIEAFDHTNDLLGTKIFCPEEFVSQIVAELIKMGFKQVLVSEER